MAIKEGNGIENAVGNIQHYIEKTFDSPLKRMN